ncbi:MAG: PLD nuclease N-terminal domain-containing protein [Robiginitalea sp.]|nr:PLD nuclease N-terminal domain-containing protein [Robiginitalea sp.]
MYPLLIGPWEVLFIIVMSTIGLLLPLIALIDILRSDFKGNDKLVWILAVLFFNVIGSILYFTIGTRQKSGPETTGA